MRNLFGAAGSAREGFSLQLSQGGDACRCTSFDHQLLTGEADSDEVQLLTVGGETEDDLFLTTFVKVGEFGLNDARGPQRCRRRGPGFRYASSGIDVFFFFRREREVASGFKRIVSRQCSLLPPLPQEGGFDVAEQRADARSPQRGMAMPAVKRWSPTRKRDRRPSASGAVAVPV